MMFVARYIHRRAKEPEYFRTVYADNVSEAMRQAEKYTRKGFVCVSVKEKQGEIK